VGLKVLELEQFLIYRRTTVSQKLPEEYEEKLNNFQKCMLSLRKRFSYLLIQYGSQCQNRLLLNVLVRGQFTLK
jgi:hypothetical protein